MHYEIKLTKEAVKDIKTLTPKIKKKLEDILRNVIAADPLSGKKLIGDLTGFYSLRLTYKDRIIYSLEKKTVTIHRAKTHYGD